MPGRALLRPGFNGPRDSQTHPAERLSHQGDHTDFQRRRACSDKAEEAREGSSEVHRGGEGVGGRARADPPEGARVSVQLMVALEAAASHRGQRHPERQDDERRGDQADTQGARHLVPEDEELERVERPGFRGEKRKITELKGIASKGYHHGDGCEQTEETWSSRGLLQSRSSADCVWSLSAESGTQRSLTHVV